MKTDLINDFHPIVDGDQFRLLLTQKPFRRGVNFLLLQFSLTIERFFCAQMNDQKMSPRSDKRRKKYELVCH